MLQLMMMKWHAISVWTNKVFSIQYSVFSNLCLKVKYSYACCLCLINVGPIQFSVVEISRATSILDKVYKCNLYGVRKFQ